MQNLIYKRTESSSILKQKRLQSSLESNNSSKFCEEPEIFISDKEFKIFYETFHDGVQKDSVQMIFISLYHFFSNIAYTDERSNLFVKFLSDESLNCLEEISTIIDDIIHCLQLPLNAELAFAIFVLCDFLFYSDFFVNEFLERDGLKSIISHFGEFTNEQLLLKSIILLVNFSKCSKSHQKLIDPEFTDKLYAFCNSLFIQKKLNCFKEIAYNTIILLRQIVGILIEQDEIIEQQTLGLGIGQQQELINEHKFDEINKLIGHFFYSFYPEIQKEAIKTLYLLYNEPYFINIIFPSILDYIPTMQKGLSPQKNELILKNKIKLYKLIALFYSNDDDYEIFNIKSSYISQFAIPFDTLINSLSSDNNKEVIAALDIFNVLFHYDMISIEIAYQKELHCILMEMIECAPFDIKEQALIAVSTWITHTNNSVYKQPFIDFDFVDVLFDLIEAREENVRNASKDVIILLKYLNTDDDEFNYFIDDRFQMIDEENENDED